MASSDHQSEVIDLVADERGISREKLHVSDRLLQDLGMDGASLNKLMKNNSFPAPFMVN